MKRIFVIFILLILGKWAFSQKLDSLCSVSVMTFEDTSIFKVIDTLYFLEQRSGTDVSDKDKVSITFIDTGGSCMIHWIKDSLSELTVLSSMVEYVRIAHYRNLNIILISGIVPNKKIMSVSNEHMLVRCVSYSENEVLYEDYANIEEEPNYYLLARWKNGHIQIYMIVNRKGEVVYDSSVDLQLSLEKIRQ